MGATLAILTLRKTIDPPVSGSVSELHPVSTGHRRQPEGLGIS